jgi:hypothetical protein
MPTDVLYEVPTDLRADSDLEIRIRAEFAEMPGLKLTVPQASRLFSVDCVRCRRLLEGLVRDRVLSSRGDLFLRADFDRSPNDPVTLRRSARFPLVQASIRVPGHCLNGVEAAINHTSQVTDSQHERDQ